MISSILLTKLAHDAGFDVELGESAGFLSFAVPGRTLRAWLRTDGDSVVIALSRLDVLQELDKGKVWSGSYPSAARGVRAVATADELVVLLVRARVLDQTLPQALLHKYEAAIANIDSTEALALVKQRRGQELFRMGLMEYWQGRCAITDLDVPELLRASHAKPWKDGTDAERLDVHNGLLLAAHLDAAFDQGLITVGADGAVIASSVLKPYDIAVLGLEKPCWVKNLRPAHSVYLAWHRQKVFVTGRSWPRSEG